MLLQLKHFEAVINLQPIKKDKPHAAKLHAKLQSPIIITKKHRLELNRILTLLKKVKEVNQINNHCTQICVYLKAPSK